jgi:hypothetical protein
MKPTYKKKKKQITTTVFIGVEIRNTFSTHQGKMKKIKHTFLQRYMHYYVIKFLMTVT